MFKTHINEKVKLQEKNKNVFQMIEDSINLSLKDKIDELVNKRINTVVEDVF